MATVDNEENKPLLWLTLLPENKTDKQAKEEITEGSHCFFQQEEMRALKCEQISRQNQQLAQFRHNPDTFSFALLSDRLMT